MVYHSQRIAYYENIRLLTCRHPNMKPLQAKKSGFVRFGRILSVVLLCLWILISSTLAVLFFHYVPYLFMLLFLRPKLYRYLADELIGSWLVYCVVCG